MQNFYVIIIVVECVIFGINLLIPGDYFLTTFILINIIFMPSAAFIIIRNWKLIQYYYDHKVYDYKPYFHNSKIERLHNCISDIFTKIPHDSPYFSGIIDILEPQTKWNDHITAIYTKSDMEFSGSPEEVLLDKVSYYKDDLRLFDKERFFYNAHPDFKQPLINILNEVYADYVINKPANLSITDNQYDYYAMLLNIIPRDIVECLFLFEHFERTFLFKYITGLLMTLCCLVAWPLVGAIFIVVIVIAFLYLLIH